MRNDKSISIAELEQELQTEEAFDELECGKSGELSVPTYVDPDAEPTTAWEITTNGIHEIKPTSLTRWINDEVETFWVSFR
ncbi:MAG: hypothetical protein HOV81_17365 [Kofleriaceae bacterium]|nr:hypothetical protein [Kofleriaceae bacterium]